MPVENLVRRLQRAEGFLRKPAVRRAIGGIVMLLSFGYMGHILARHWSDLTAYDWQVNYGLAVVGFLCYSIALGCAVVGWSLIMHRLTPSTGFSKHLKYYIYANLLKRLPAPLLDLVGRVYLYDREGIGKRLMVTVSLLERVVLVLSGIVVYVLTSSSMPLPRVWRSPLIPLGILIVGLLLVRPKTLRAILRLVGQGELSVSFRYSDLLLWLGVYSLVWLTGGVVLHLGINSVYALPMDQLPAVIGIWVVSGLIPTLMLITPVGLGLKEVTLSFLLGYLLPAHLAVIVALLMRVALVLFELLWGLVALKL